MFNRIKSCKTAKEIWDKLIELCEGSESSKKNKLDIFLTKFQSIRMNEGETIEHYEIRICSILNELASLDKILTKEEVNHKILNSLSPAWEIKSEIMKGMQEGDNLTTSEFWSELKAHEFSKLKGKIESEETTSQNLALAVKTKASIFGNDKSDLHALFMKRMERIERKNRQDFTKQRRQFEQQQKS